MIAGLGKRRGDEKEVIVDAVRSITAAIDAGNRPDAIRRAMALRHHGLAFASKLLAFISPDTECVYDEVISLRLRASADERLKALHVSTSGQHRMSEKIQAYVGWAELCSKTASRLNAAGVQWIDWNSQAHPWRAVDVERAYFGLGRPE